MPTAKKIRSLGDFMNEVSLHRERWRVEEDKELWFRGESREYRSPLRPELYRPRQDTSSGDDLPLKPISDLLRIENNLHEDFQRCAVQLSDEKKEDEDWEWDSYFLMQHHGGPTRLLDWSDGALMALHFALRNKRSDSDDAHVYVLEPYRLIERIEALPDIEVLKQNWKAYVEKHPSYELSEDEWDYSYLPADEDDLAELYVPAPPLVLDFPHITRRVAAQRSRFIVFGTDPDWLAVEFRKPDSCIEEITINSNSRHRIRQQLRDSGITESVIYPDLDGLDREMKQLWEDRK
jgi:hypothetical protein